MITQNDIKQMPVTFIIAPVVLLSLTFVVFNTYADMIEEKVFISNLSCPELEEYALRQEFESKLYFGHEAYLKYAEELYQNYC